MKFSIKDFFNKCDQIRSFLRIWSHLMKKSLMENFIFCAVNIAEHFLLKTEQNLTSFWEIFFCYVIFLFTAYFVFSIPSLLSPILKYKRVMKKTDIYCNSRW